MSTTIYYRGRFKGDASLDDMIDIVQSVCEVHSWQHIVFERNFPGSGFTRVSDGKIYGISFRPPSSETISLCFLSTGRMCSAMELEFLKLRADTVEQDRTGMIGSKTHFAGMQVHAIIIRLFKFLHEKYFDEFKLIDDAHYWETNDLKVLEESFEKLNIAQGILDDVFDTMLDSDEESVEEHFNRVLGANRNN